MIGIKKNPQLGRIIAIAICALLLIAFAVTGWTAWLGKCATFDEPLHFMGAWIQTHDDDFRNNPEDPPLWKFYIAAGTDPHDLKLDKTSPIWNLMLQSIPGPAVQFDRMTLYQTKGNDADAVLRRARARMLFLGVILGAVIAWWAWRLAGPVAAVVATAAFAGDPNFLAHSPLIKNDVLITLIFLLLMAAIWLLGERGTWLRCLSICLLIAVALTTKFSGLLAIPMLAIALFLRAMMGRPWPFLRWMLTTRVQRLTAAAVIMVAVLLVGYAGIWACYGFRFGPTPNPAEKFDFHDVILDTAENEMILRHDPAPVYVLNAQLQQWVEQWKPHGIVNIVKWADKNHFLPEAWLFGFLYTYGTSLLRRTFLCGEIGVAGWWNYFPLAIIFKTPVGTLAGFFLAIVFWVWTRIKALPFGSRRNGAWASCVFLVAPVFYMAVAMRGNLNIGLRHILPVYPYIFIFLGVMAAAAFRWRPKMAGCVVGILILGLFVETGAAFPDYIPFFNVAVGGSRGGLALLGDSNLDWGQDLPALAEWQQKHPDRQIYLCQFALPDPRYYGIHYFEMDGAHVVQEDEQPRHGVQPVFAISAVALQGAYLTQDQLKIYGQFKKEKPIAVLHGTIYLYDLPLGK